MHNMQFSNTWKTPYNCELR